MLVLEFKKKAGFETFFISDLCCAGLHFNEIICCDGRICGGSMSRTCHLILTRTSKQFSQGFFCLLKLYLRTPPKTLRPIFSVIISSILSNWPSVLWWINSLMAGFKTSPFATTLSEENTFHLVFSCLV